jgi:NAD-dependent deacetylase sirtuin 2
MKKLKAPDRKMILSSASLEAFCEHLKTLEKPKIIVLSGAGISTSAGIPDFRTQGSGLYSNLKKYNLPYAEAIFDIEYFLRKPQPFYELSRELFPGTFNPTPCHHFLKVLDEKGWLLRNYSQNIDMLERLAGVEGERIVEAHGSFHSARCVGYARNQYQDTPLYETCPEDALKPDTLSNDDQDSNSSSDSEEGIIRVRGCGKPYTIEQFKKAVFQNDIPKCDDCSGLVKPDIVFFGEQLPDRFHTLIAQDFKQCDALIVMGTSLQVMPFASLIDRVIIGIDFRYQSIFLVS